MLDPAAYAALHPVSGPVRCIETHVSWVFLTGQFAYKVKKPLRLSFIDYSTAARRAECCREELRLNQRNAPGLYLGVVPIAGTFAAPRIVAGDMDGSAPAFEHALRMVQFDPAQELGHLLQAAAVTPQECADLGARVAQMHATASRVELDAPYGVPEAVHRVTLDNFDELTRFVATAAEASLLQSLQQRARSLFEAGRMRMAARRERGCIREGHGDLHCGNVVRWQGVLVPFDGLEFDPALRWIDVANDIAFLTMDLAAHQRDDLRREALQAWLTAAGDFDALTLLPYFELYRALVRAKVAALRGQQAGATAQPSASTPRYLEWAATRITRPAPTLVLMAGLSGSGKTWFGARIASHMQALVVRSDVERKRLAGLSALASSASPPDAGLYSVEFNARTYARLRDCAAASLQGGESIVVDAANLRREERAQFVALARKHGANPVIVHCTAPLEVLRARVAARAAAAADASEATVALLDRQPSYWEPLGADELDRVVTVDTTDPQAIERALPAIAALTAARRDAS
jgi:aminoglycoside phosphotransferase family enzyme/predicted kinase